MNCGKAVSDHTGFHFWPCGKPAKWLIRITIDGEEYPFCGIHAKPYRSDPPRPHATIRSSKQHNDQPSEKP